MAIPKSPLQYTTTQPQHITYTTKSASPTSLTKINTPTPTPTPTLHPISVLSPHNSHSNHHRPRYVSPISSISPKSFPPYISSTDLHSHFSVPLHPHHQPILDYSSIPSTPTLTGRKRQFLQSPCSLTSDLDVNIDVRKRVRLTDEREKILNSTSNRERCVDEGTERDLLNGVTGENMRV